MTGVRNVRGRGLHPASPKGSRQSAVCSKHCPNPTYHPSLSAAACQETQSPFPLSSPTLPPGERHTLILIAPEEGIGLPPERSDESTFVVSVVVLGLARRDFTGPTPSPRRNTDCHRRPSSAELCRGVANGFDHANFLRPRQRCASFLPCGLALQQFARFSHSGTSPRTASTHPSIRAQRPAAPLARG